MSSQSDLFSFWVVIGSGSENQSCSDGVKHVLVLEFLRSDEICEICI